MGNYPNDKVYQIRMEKHDLTQIVDTIQLIPISHGYSDAGVLGYGMTVEPKFTGNFNHIIMSYGSTRFDTITNVSYTRSKCNRMEEIAYFWNGEYSNDASREIHQ
jgi:hypothetical protein